MGGVGGVMPEGRWCEAAREQAPGVVGALDRRWRLPTLASAAPGAARPASGARPAGGGCPVDCTAPVDAGLTIVRERSPVDVRCEGGLGASDVSAPPKGHGAPSDDRATHEAPLHDATVLTVEDDAYMLGALGRTLQRLGARFLGARSPSEAMALARADRWIDVAVVDLILGFESGLSLAWELRRLRPGLPLLVISGDLEAIEEAEAFGFTALPKPFGSDQFIAAIEAVMSRRAP